MGRHIISRSTHLQTKKVNTGVRRANGSNRAGLSSSPLSTVPTITTSTTNTTIAAQLPVASSLANAFAGRKSPAAAAKLHSPPSDRQPGAFACGPANTGKPLCNGMQSHVRLQHSLHHTACGRPGAARHLRGIYGRLKERSSGAFSAKGPRTVVGPLGEEKKKRRTCSRVCGRWLER